MKRKRPEIGYQKDELLVETTALNLSFNRRFEVEHNILLYEYAKDKEAEFIYRMNRIVEKAIDTGIYIGMEDIKLLCEQ
tara:strand:+ start:7746 stop:7982 length:237 start_codon:yes stop_codon:yes gene_type:complete